MRILAVRFWVVSQIILISFWGKLPEWMKLPMSMAVPFGAFEKAFAVAENEELVTEYNSLVKLAEENPDISLAKLRELILQFAQPPGFKDDFMKIWQESGFTDISWEVIWLTIKRVWASKWNNRAFFFTQTSWSGT